jgi:hypothetical protein
VEMAIRHVLVRYIEPHQFRVLQISTDSGGDNFLDAVQLPLPWDSMLEKTLWLWVPVMQQDRPADSAGMEGTHSELSGPGDRARESRQGEGSRVPPGPGTRRMRGCPRPLPVVYLPAPGGASKQLASIDTTLSDRTQGLRSGDRRPSAAPPR